MSRVKRRLHARGLNRHLQIKVNVILNLFAHIFVCSSSYWLILILLMIKTLLKCRCEDMLSHASDGGGFLFLSPGYFLGSFVFGDMAAGRMRSTRRLRNWIVEQVCVCACVFLMWACEAEK